jgi:hypothetical protein
VWQGGGERESRDLDNIPFLEADEDVDMFEPSDEEAEDSEEMEEKRKGKNGKISQYYNILAHKARGVLRKSEAVRQAQQLELNPTIMILLNNTEIHRYSSLSTLLFLMPYKICD